MTTSSHYWPNLNDVAKNDCNRDQTQKEVVPNSNKFYPKQSLREGMKQIGRHGGQRGKEMMNKHF